MFFFFAGTVLGSQNSCVFFTYVSEHITKNSSCKCLLYIFNEFGEESVLFISNIFIFFCKQISQESAGYDQPTGMEEGEEEEFEHEMQAQKSWLSDFYKG